MRLLVLMELMVDDCGFIGIRSSRFMSNFTLGISSNFWCLFDGKPGYIIKMFNGGINNVNNLWVEMWVRDV
jgi:hypothetical protein